MKYTLLLLLFPFYAFSQQYEITVGGGIGSNSFNSDLNNNPTYSGHKTINPAGMLRLRRYIVPHIQVGVQITPSILTYKEQVTTLTVYGKQTWDIKDIIANPAIPLLLVGDYSVHHFYAGVGVGYLFPVIVETNKSDAGTSKFYEYSHTNSTPVFNLHAGYKKNIIDGYALDIAASYNTCNFSSTKTFSGGTINFYNLLIGISKKIGK